MQHPKSVHEHVLAPVSYNPTNQTMRGDSHVPSPPPEHAGHDLTAMFREARRAVDALPLPPHAHQT